MSPTAPISAQAVTAFTEAEVADQLLRHARDRHQSPHLGEANTSPFALGARSLVLRGGGGSATWQNSKVVGPYDAEAIRRLKKDVDGDLYFSGGGTCVRAMLTDGAVDALHLFVYPLTRGSGPWLFPEDAAPIKLSLAECQSYANGVVYVSYRPQSEER